MHKILLIARRDYLQTVTGKAYLVALVVMPVIFGSGFLGLTIASRGNTTTQRIGVIDHTGVSAASIIETAQEANRRSMFNPATGLQVLPQFTFEELKPDADEDGQLLEVANRIRSGDLFLVLDIPATALHPSGDASRDRVVYYTNSAGPAPLTSWLSGAVNDGLRRVRLAQGGMEAARISEVLREVQVESMNLARKDPATGKILPGAARNQIQTTVVPLVLVVLLVVVVMLGAAPHIGAVAEDKMQRVFEMLLSSASAFDLMMGKVLAALGACLTTSTLYLAVGLIALGQLALFGMAPLHLLPWFLVYLIADVLMLSAMGVALGSACGSAQDAQQLAFLLFLPIVIPMLTLTRITQQPNGPFATVMSFIPPFTPVLMLLRQAMPGGVPGWQPWVGLIGVTACVFAVVWAAARIFRIGILSQGKTPKLAELAQWALRG